MKWINEGERIRRVIIKEEVKKGTRRRDERSRRNEWEMLMMQEKNEGVILEQENGIIEGAE